MDKFIKILSNFAYTIGCLCLYLISLWIITAAIVGIITDLRSDHFTIYKLLDDVALIVFSVAVIDVSKYLMIEEVLKGDDNRSPRDARRAFTKFVIIIITALSLEGLVITIETVKTDVTHLIYPIFLFFTATILMVGLGVYQKLNADSEKN